MTRDEDLLKNRVLFMFKEFNEENCHEFVKNFLILKKDNSTDDIMIYIDSYGGSVHSFLQLHDLIKGFQGNVHTICYGKAMSAGAYFLLSGTKGKRFASRNAQIMLHELAYSESYKKLHDHKNSFEDSKKLQLILNKIVVDNTKIKSKDIKNYLEQDQYMSATEALKLGIIDKIIGD